MQRTKPYTPSEVAELLNVTISTVHDMEADGRLSGFRIPGKKRDILRIRPESVHEILEGKRNVG